MQPVTKITAMFVTAAAVVAAKLRTIIYELMRQFFCRISFWIVSLYSDGWMYFLASLLHKYLVTPGFYFKLCAFRKAYLLITKIFIILALKGAVYKRDRLRRV